MTEEKLTAENDAKPSRGFWSQVRCRFMKRRLSVIALCYVVLMGVMAICSPLIVGTKPIVCYYKGSYYFPALGYFNSSWENVIFKTSGDKFRNVYPKNLDKKDPESWAIWPLVYQDPIRRVRKNEWTIPEEVKNQSKDAEPDWRVVSNPTRDKGRPSNRNFFGTNQAGIDVFAQMVHGTRTALVVGFVSMGIASFIGILIGSFAGYFGGWVDMLLSRLIEVVMCIPSLVLILALIAIIEQPTIWHLMAVLGCTSWTGIARLTRAEFLRLKEMDYVAAARAVGVGRMAIMFRHVFRNAMAPVLVPITFGIASAILTESALSFLGFGAPPPNPSWGTLLNAGRTNTQMWWLILFPGLAIFFTVLAYNLIGEGLQEATDPRLNADE